MEKVLCGILWRGDGRGGVFDPYSGCAGGGGVYM